ncbi:MAG: NADH-quinone oxidoreductase subunit M [Chthoniobacterales bacterium]|nr:NADH-quinone oxidoreductase subunit M [Chthoniobacterales bacterium]
MSPLLFLIFLPFVAIILILCGAPARLTSLLTTGLNFLLSLFLCYHYNLVLGGWQYLQETKIVPKIGLNFTLGADGLSLTLLLLTGLVSFTAICVTPKMERSPNLFYCCLLIITAGLAGAFSSLDTFFLYGFHEIALIPVFIMIGIWGSGDRQAAAWKATLYLGADSLIVLLGIIALYLSAPTSFRSFDFRVMAELSQNEISHPASWIYLLLLAGFGTLVSLFPFHSWAPSTYSSAPAPTAMLHAGVLKKFGLYGLIRLALPIFPVAVGKFSMLLLILLICNIIYIGYVTIAQRRLDWTIAYSSVMHMGTIFLGLVAFNMLSLSGAALLMFGHGLSIAVLFALCGALRARTETLTYDELGGLAQLLPKASLLFGFGTMASVGLPGFTNFAGEILIFFGATATVIINQGSKILIIAIIAALWGVVISAIYMLRAYRSVFFGPIFQAERWTNIKDLSLKEFAPVTLLLVVLLITGIFPQLILNLVNTAFR